MRSEGPSSLTLPATHAANARRSEGFTLIELLTVVAIVGLLAAITIPVMGKVRDSSRRAVAISQMRQIGLALPLYAAEHRGSLPGPVRMPQGVFYDPAKPDQLATFLAPYLGVSDLDNAAMVPVFMPPAVARQMPEAMGLERVNPFVVFIQAKQGNAFISPWGDLRANPPSAPMRLAGIPGRLFAMIDADQQNPLVAGHPFAGTTPESPVHGEKRLLLHFDASVSSLSSDQLPARPEGGPPRPPGSRPPPPPPRR